MTQQQFYRAVVDERFGLPRLNPNPPLDELDREILTLFAGSYPAHQIAADLDQPVRDVRSALERMCSFDPGVARALLDDGGVSSTPDVGPVDPTEPEPEPIEIQPPPPEDDAPPAATEAPSSNGPEPEPRFLGRYRDRGRGPLVDPIRKPAAAARAEPVRRSADDDDQADQVNQEAFTVEQAAAYVPGLTRHHLNHWTRAGWLRPVNPNPGTGHRRTWPQTELDIAATMLRLINNGGLTAADAAQIARGGQLLNLPETYVSQPQPEPPVHTDDEHPPAAYSHQPPQQQPINPSDILHQVDDYRCRDCGSHHVDAVTILTIRRQVA